MPIVNPYQQLPNYSQSAWQRQAVTEFAHKWAQQTLITTPELQKFFQQTASQTQWQPALIKQVRAFTVTPFLRELPKYAKQSRGYFAAYPVVEHLRAMPAYGDLSSAQHMFAHAALDWGFSFTEPMLTKGLVHFLARSPLANWYFLNALFDCDESEIGGTQRPDKTTFLHSASAAAEVPTAEGKRIDVLIRWRSKDGKPCLVVLECKFGHHTSKGQLPSYQRHVQTQADGGEHYFFLVLSRLDNKSQNIMRHHHNRKRWRQVKWERLLQRWETYLSHSDTPIELEGFACFRHTLWQKALQHSA